MATNTSNITLSKTNSEDWMPVPSSPCIPWLVMFGMECLAIVMLNTMTIIVFVKQRQLHRKSTYLIVNLAVVDLLVGAVTGPWVIKIMGTFYCELWEYDWNNTWFLVIERVIALGMFQASLLNLAFISLERADATFRPFKHRFIRKWVYGVIVFVIWFVPIIMSTSVYASLFLSKIDLNSSLIDFSYFAILLFVILVSYVSIYIKVRGDRLSRHYAAARVRERQLTRTLFLVTFGSFLTFLPVVINYGVRVFDSRLIKNLSINSYFHIEMAISSFVVFNSLINPLVYTIRMPELREGILQIIFRRAPRSSNPVNIPLQDR